MDQERIIFRGSEVENYCPYCNNAGGLSLTEEHFIPRLIGGDDRSIIWVCSGCNSICGSKVDILASKIPGVALLTSTTHRRTGIRGRCVLIDGIELSGLVYRDDRSSGLLFHPDRVQRNGEQWIHENCLHNGIVPRNKQVYYHKNHHLIECDRTDIADTQEIAPLITKILLGALFYSYGASVVRSGDFDCLRAVINGHWSSGIKIRVLRSPEDRGWHLPDTSSDMVFIAWTQKSTGRVMSIVALPLGIYFGVEFHLSRTTIGVGALVRKGLEHATADLRPGDLGLRTFADTIDNRYGGSHVLRQSTRFVNTEVQLDGQAFEACIFENCWLKYDGGLVPEFRSIGLIGTQQWTFGGAARAYVQRLVDHHFESELIDSTLKTTLEMIASESECELKTVEGRTRQLLTTLYHSGDRGRRTVESYFRTLREGRIQIVIRDQRKDGLRSTCDVQLTDQEICARVSDGLGRVNARQLLRCPHVLRGGSFDGIVFRGDRLIALVFLDDALSASVSRFVVEHGEPLPFLFCNSRRDNRIAFHLNGSLNCSIVDCHSNGGWSFSMSKVSSVVIENHQQSFISPASKAETYIVPLAFAVSWGRDSTKDGVLSLFDELIMSAASRWSH